MDYPKSDPTIGLVGGKFTDGNPGAGVAASRDPSSWANGVTDELLAIIMAAGLEPDENNLTQVRDALIALGLRAATTAQTGVVQLADSATAQALTDTSKPITPATLKAASQGANQSISGASGYQKFPGGVILQYGALNYGNYTSGTTLSAITFPLAFPSACRIAVATPQLGIASGLGLTAEALSTTGMNIRYTNSVAVPGLIISWFALGV